jgi:hypothetical protein
VSKMGTVWEKVKAAFFPNLTEYDYVRYQTQKKQEEQAKEDWRTLSASPAHVYLNELLGGVGLPADVTSVEGRMCSFWVHTPEDIRRTPWVTRVTGITREGNCPTLCLAAGPSLNPCVIFLYGDGSGTIAEVGFKKKLTGVGDGSSMGLSASVSNFQLL